MADLNVEFEVEGKLFKKYSVKYYHIFDDGKSILFVTHNDEVYAYGKNSFGRLGLGDVNECDTPLKLDELDGKLVRQFFIGKQFVLALTDDHQVFSWGMFHHNNGLDLVLFN